MKKKFGNRGPYLFAFFFIIMVGFIFVSHATRRVYFTQMSKYHPKENAFLLVTGTIQNLWEKTESHFKDSMADDEDENGFVTQLLHSVKQAAEDKNLSCNTIDDLREHGIDVSRGVMLSLQELKFDEQSIPPVSDKGLLIFPLLEKEKFLRAFSKLTETEIDQTLSPDIQRVISQRMMPNKYSFSTINMEDFFLTSPDTGSMILSTYGSLFKNSLYRAVQNQDMNYSHLLNNDSLYELLRYQYGFPIGKGSGAFMIWKARNYPPIKEVAGVLRLENDHIAVNLDLYLWKSGINLLGSLFTPLETDLEWADHLSADTAIVFVYQDPSLSDYLELGHHIESVGSEMKNKFGGIVSELRMVDSLNRLLMAVTGYRDGLPEVLLGIWGDSQDIGNVFSGVQKRIRENRDISIITAAGKRAEKGHNNPNQENFFEKNSLFRQETYPSFDKYRLMTDGTLMSNLDQSFFNNADYQETYKGHIIRFLLPPITENDLIYRDELSEYQCCITGCDKEDSVDCEGLFSNRFRLAYSVVDSIMWMATDIGEIKKLIDRFQHRDTRLLSSDSVFLRACANWSDGQRLQLFLNLERMYVLNALNAESRLDKKMKEFLWDFRHHKAISVSLKTIMAQDRIRLEARCFR